MSFAASAVRTAKQAPKLARSIHTSKPLQYDDHYIHATHMYDVKGMKNRKLKFGAAIIGILTGGLGLPFYAVHWQKTKAAG